MPTSRSTLIDGAEQLLGDSGNLVFAAVDVGTQLDAAVKEASTYVPYVVRDGVIATASNEIDISGLTNLMRVTHAEYLVGQTPRELRNIEYLTDDLINIEYWTTPTAGNDLYLYCKKYHVLVDPPSTLTGAVVGDTAANTTSVPIDGLGTGTIKAGTLVTFTGIMGQYKVSADATITANAATIVLTGGLREAVGDNTVVTLKCSSLSGQLERVIPELAAAHCAMNWTYDARSQFDLAVTDMGVAKTEADLADAQVDLGVTATASASSLANKVNVGAGVSDYLNIAQLDNTNANGYLQSAAGANAVAAGRARIATLQLNLHKLGQLRYQMAINELRRMRSPRYFRDVTR